MNDARASGTFCIHWMPNGVDMEIIYVKQKSKIHNISIMVPFLLQCMYWYERETERREEREWMREQAALALHGSAACKMDYASCSLQPVLIV